MRKTICICGGGALSHTSAGFIASHGHYDVRVLTRHPEQWNNNQLIIDDELGNQFVARLSMVTSSSVDAIKGADIVLLCVPGFAINDILKTIAPHLEPSACVGSIVSSTGFFFLAQDVLPQSTKLFGFQRVPFIARTKDYGRHAIIKGYKKQLFVATHNMSVESQKTLLTDVEMMFNMPVVLLKNFYEASLTNSNPLLHTSRMYSMWKDWKEGITYDKCPQFYTDWTIDAARYYITMDREFQEILKVLPVTPGTIPNVLDYYESTDEESLTRKLRSINAFKGIMAPMTGNAVDGFIPDFKSRYFTEDFPFGLRWIVEVARRMNIKTPVIDKVYDWGIKTMKGSSY